jgi:phosphoserine phosphatase
MRTTLYLLRHGATEANLARPARLLGCKLNPPLAPLGVRQAECTRDLLAVRPIDLCYASPLKRAVQTADIISAPHELEPIVHKGLIECDLGVWEGLDWEHIRRTDAERYQQFMKNPARHGYPDGESFADVFARTSKVMDELFARHAGHTILVVAHHVVNRVYLASLLGMGVEEARLVSLHPCAISILEHDGERTTVATLNAAFHLQGLAA